MFWKTTPRLVALIFKGEHQRLERERKLAAWSAWHIAALGKSDPKKFPALEDLTGDRPAPRVQTPDEMKSVFAAMRARAAKG